MNIQIVPVGESILPPSLYLLPGGSVARNQGQQSNFYLLDLAVLDGYFPRAAGFSDLNPIAVSLTRTPQGLYYLTYDHDALLLARPVYNTESAAPRGVNAETPGAAAKFYACDDAQDACCDTCDGVAPRPHLAVHARGKNPAVLTVDDTVAAELIGSFVFSEEPMADGRYNVTITLPVDKVVLA